MTQLDGKSMNIINDNIEKLKEIFPEVFNEGKIDFDKLQSELGNFIDPKDERYNFTWNGKSEAKKIALTPSTGTLRPAKVESKNWDTTQNLYIEGDNLEVLKLLQKSYHKKVKMIYIDPPYNTGKDFVYKDNFRDNIKNYMQLTGQVDSEGNRLSTNSETNGRYHSDWLNMMYPRLKLARNLLKDDGVIFISIDDNEVANLRKLCDEIFGEDNFVGILPTIMNLKGNNDQYGFAGTHEHTLVYTKNYSMSTFYEFYVSEAELDDWQEDEYGLYKKGANLKATGINAPRHKRPNLFFPIYVDKNCNVQLKFHENFEEIYPITDGEEMSWRWSKEKFENELHNLIITRNGDNISIYKKQRSQDNDRPTKKPKSIFNKPDYSSGNGTQIIKELFNGKVFDFPKPISLIYDFITIGTRNDDLILDFFSGSATTAHAVMKLNSEDDGNRKFICVQLPETTDEQSEAHKAGYKNICEIGKERIRRAGEKVKSESGKSELDIGFKVLKLDSSNIKTWDSDFEDLEQNLLSSVDNIKSDRASEDLLYEILLKYGLDLTLPIEVLVINGKKVFSIGFGAMVVCLENGIDSEVIEKIAGLKKQFSDDYGLENMRVVFRDGSFENSVVKTNALAILKQHGIDEVVSV